jgi:superfamily II DNA or RNA helicase
MNTILSVPVLRDYQVLLVNQIYHFWASGKKRIIAQLPTGSGKTLIFSQIASEFAVRGEKVLILAHRAELIEQAVKKISNITNLDIGVIKSGVKPNYSAPIQVASVMSLKSRAENLSDISVVIVDECHHSMAKEWRAILVTFADQYILGMTATPVRLDGSGFIDLYLVLLNCLSEERMKPV